MKEEIRDWLIEQDEDDSIQDFNLEEDCDHPDYEEWFRETYCNK